MRRIPPLGAVRAFEAAARHENFTRAAAELGMTQAAVSYQIRVLEERLGVLLFNRSKRRVSLTDAGRKVAPLISAAFDTLSDAFAAVVGDNENILSISTAQTFASNWLAPRLGAFQMKSPDLAVRLHVSDALVDFASDEVDIAVRAGKGAWQGLKSDFLFRLHFTPLCAPEFVSRHGLTTPADLLNVPRTSPDDVWWKLWFDGFGLSETDAPRGGIKLDSQTLDGNAALAGHSIAILTPIFWQKDLASGRLIQPFSEIGLYDRSYWLVYPEFSRNQPKIRAFREWLLAEVAACAAHGPAAAFVPAVEP